METLDKKVSMWMNRNNFHLTIEMYAMQQPVNEE